MNATLQQRVAAEALGTAFLVANVVGSGIMADTLTKDAALALLGNTIPTGAILVVLITILGPISGAHFNPAVSLVFALKRDIAPREAALYVTAQVIGGVLGAFTSQYDVRPPLSWNCLRRRGRAHRSGSRNGSRHWARADHPRGRSLCARFRAVAGRALHYRGLLVHRVDVLRQSGRGDRPIVDQHFSGIRPRTRRFHHHAALGAVCGMMVATWLLREGGQGAGTDES